MKKITLLLPIFLFPHFIFAQLAVEDSFLIGQVMNQNARDTEFQREMVMYGGTTKAHQERDENNKLKMLEQAIITVNNTKELVRDTQDTLRVVTNMNQEIANMRREMGYLYSTAAGLPTAVVQLGKQIAETPKIINQSLKDFEKQASCLQEDMAYYTTASNMYDTEYGSSGAMEKDKCGDYTGGTTKSLAESLKRKRDATRESYIKIKMQSRIIADLAENIYSEAQKSAKPQSYKDSMASMANLAAAQAIELHSLNEKIGIMSQPYLEKAGLEAQREMDREELVKNDARYQWAREEYKRNGWKPDGTPYITISRMKQILKKTSPDNPIVKYYPRKSL